MLEKEKRGKKVTERGRERGEREENIKDYESREK